MSSNPPQHLDGPLTGRPKREELLASIDQRISKTRQEIIDFDITHIHPIRDRLPVGMAARLHSKEDIEGYFRSSQASELFIKSFFEIILGLLDKLEAYLKKDPQQISDDTLYELSLGISSHLFDFTLYKGVEDAARIREEGGVTSMQNNPTLLQQSAELSRDYINLPDLLKDLMASTGKENSERELAAFILELAKGFPGEDKIDLTYEDFKKLIREKLGSNISISRATSVITEYMYAMQLVAGAFSDPFVSDLISNVFNIMSGYITTIQIGGMSDPEWE